MKYRVSIYFHERPHHSGQSVTFVVEADDEDAVHAWLRLTNPREVDWCDVEEIVEEGR